MNFTVGKGRPEKEKTPQLQQAQFVRFTTRNIVIALSLVLGYMLWLYQTGGIKVEHALVVGFMVLMYFARPTSRKFVLAFIFFFIYVAIYDSIRVFPPYLYNEVHIVEPYELEKALFGISTTEGVVTPNEYFETHTSPTFDILGGFFYISWIPIPILFMIFLFFKDRKTLLDFTMAFFLVNLIGLSIYYLYPAAPPWYVELYGFKEHFDIHGSSAGLANFDKHLEVNIFRAMYEKNANVFGAIPSLHAAFPVLLLYFGLKKRYKKLSAFFLIVLLGIWFTAVYSRHHYIIDVILGGLCSIAAILLLETLYKYATFRKFMSAHLKLVV